MVSGTYFPITGFNTWVAAAASLLPLTLALDALRQLTFTSGAAVGFLNPRIEAAALALMGVVFVYAAQRSLAFMEEQAVRNGRLTESRG
jgi:ABC-2 type transport system permease protein